MSPIESNFTHARHEDEANRSFTHAEIAVKAPNMQRTQMPNFTLVSNLDLSRGSPCFDLPRRPFCHMWDKFQLIASLFDNLFDLADTEPRLDLLDILLRFDDTHAVLRDARHVLPVRGVLRHYLDHLQCLVVELQQRLPSARLSESRATKRKTLSWRTHLARIRVEL